MSIQPNQPPGTSLPTVRAGDPITAGLFNALVAEVARLRNRLDGRQAADQNTAAPDLLRMVIPCRITAASHTTPTAAGSVTYTVTGDGDRFEQTSMTPTYGRPSEGSDWVIHPAKVGERCWIVREIDEDGEPVARLWILTEKIAPGEDCPAP
jgi:hypothetical protein